jgi:hypothetical protein
MDRWFMRTFNRITGTVADPLISPMAGQLSRLLKALNLTKATMDCGYSVASMKAKIRKIRDQIVKGKVTPDNAFKVFGQVADWCQEHERQFVRSRFKNRTGLNMGNHTLWTSLFEPNESPGNGGERTWIREVVAQTQSLLKRRGIDISNADLQAVLWYYEKKLYAKFGYKAPRGAPTDYAEAARDLLQERGSR